MTAEEANCIHYLSHPSSSLPLALSFTPVISHTHTFCPVSQQSYFLVSVDRTASCISSYSTSPMSVACISREMPSRLIYYHSLRTVQSPKNICIYAVSHAHDSSFIAHTADLLSFRCHARHEFYAHLEGILRRRVEHFRFYSRSLGLFVGGARMIARCGHTQCIFFMSSMINARHDEMTVRNS